MRDAFEKNHDDEPSSIRDAYILGAAQWILWNGQNLFTQIRYPGDAPIQGQKWTPGTRDHDEPIFTLERWHFWRYCFRTVPGKYGASDECKSVAVKVVNMMDAFEENMKFQGYEFF